MDSLKLRSIVAGHLLLTAPAIAAILVLPFLGLRQFGPDEFIYYVLAGVALAWQWYSLALPSWKKWLMGKGIPQEELESLSRHAGFAWPAERSALGFFAIHTTAAAICGFHFGHWLVGRWFVWIPPLLGRSSPTPTGNEYLEHFELASIVPAFFVGYLLSRHFRKLATCAWIVPTAILAYRLVMFTEPPSSVLAHHSSTRFQYFFAIRRTMPWSFADSDLVRIALQMTAVAPFYAGLAYTAGALAGLRDVFRRFFSHPSVASDPEMTRTHDEPEQDQQSERPVHEVN